MKWFEGGIPAAIQSAKNNNSVFIVFVSGDGEASTEMEQRLHSDEVTSLCEGKKCVAVKLASDSNDCKFFSQIYPVVLIPSTFFIAHSGVPLEVIGEVKSSEDFLAKVKTALELQSKMIKDQATSSQGESSNSNSNVETGAAAAAAASVSEEGGDQLSEEQQRAALEDKVERAKQLVEQKREDKMKKEAEEEKRRERERREVGQSVQRLRDQQRQQEMIEASKELKKNREEDRLARQRVKDEIARDKAEKAARFGQAKEERLKAQEETRKRKLEEQAQQQADLARRSDQARLQFRLPDGSSVMETFPATNTFESVHQFITQHVGATVTLSTTFPRRTFSSADFNCTLQELELAPSAAILVLPGSTRHGTVRSSSESSTLMTWLSLLFSPLLFVWSSVASLLGLSRGSSVPSSRDRNANAESDSASGGDRSTSTAHRRNVGGGAASRQDGSVHRFHNAEDDQDPDDKNTWNGNSTQQM